MDWEGGPYMYGGVNLPRHAKPKREVSKKGMCQRDAGYARNISVDLFEIISISR